MFWWFPNHQKKLAMSIDLWNMMWIVSINSKQYISLSNQNNHIFQKFYRHSFVTWLSQEADSKCFSYLRHLIGFIQTLQIHFWIETFEQLLKAWSKSIIFEASLQTPTSTIFTHLCLRISIDSKHDLNISVSIFVEIAYETKKETHSLPHHHICQYQISCIQIFQGLLNWNACVKRFHWW